MDWRQRGLEIEEDPALEKKLHWVRVIGWGIFSLILIAALAGLVGRGPLSRRRVGDDSGYLRYNRFEHANAETRLVVGYSGRAFEQSDVLRVELGRSYLERMSIERVMPEPIRQELTKDGNAFVFARAGEDAGGEIIFELKKTTVGSANGTAKIGDSAPMIIRQFFYP